MRLAKLNAGIRNVARFSLKILLVPVFIAGVLLFIALVLVRGIGALIACLVEEL